jgi:hypothetical protein
MINALTASAAILAAGEKLIAALEREALLVRLSAKHPEEDKLHRECLDARRKVAEAECSYADAIRASYEKCRHYRMGEAA